MRKLLIVAGVLLVLVVATVVAATLSLNRLIAGSHDRIVAEAQAVLGRPVAVARISVSLWGGIAVRLDDVRIAEDPRFGSDDFVRIAALSAHAKLWPLLRQRFELSRIVASQPQINVIRDAAGEWNYATLPPLAPRQTSALAAGIIRVATTAATPEPAAPNAVRAAPFLVAHASIADGTLVVIDRSQPPERTTRVTHLDAALRYIDAASPLEVTIAAAVAAETRNVDVHGGIGPRDKDRTLPLQLDGTLGPFAEFNAQVDALHVVGALSAAQVHVKELTGRLLGGAITFGGDFPLQPGAPVALRGTVRDLDLAQAIDAVQNEGPARIGGKAHLIIDVSGTGTTRDAIEANLSGRVVADIVDGALMQLNLANEVLGKASRLPVIGSVVSEKIKPKYPRLFADPDTHFKTLHAVFTIAEQRAETDDLTIATAEYGVVGRGWIGFNRQMDMAGKLRMSKQFSSDVVADVHAAKYLLDSDGQFALPFHLRGKLGEARPNLDNDDIMTLVQRGAARGGVKDLLDKFFGGKP